MAELKTQTPRKFILETASLLAGEEVWVKVVPVLIAKDYSSLSAQAKANQNEDPMQFTYLMLAHLIKEWNLTSGGEPLAISPENLEALPIDDLEFITENTSLGKQLDSFKKKTLLSTSSQLTPAKLPRKNHR